jgi:hypothetical protein
VNVIGVAGYEAQKTKDGIWIEPLEEGVMPIDLYEAQFERRKKIENKK